MLLGVGNGIVDDRRQGKGIGKPEVRDRLTGGDDGELDLGVREEDSAQAPAATTQAFAVISSPSVLTRTELRRGSIPVTRRWSRTTAPATTAAASNAWYALSARVVPPSGW